jgi:hypothetical protein
MALLPWAASTSGSACRGGKGGVPHRGQAGEGTGVGACAHLGGWGGGVRSRAAAGCKSESLFLPRPNAAHAAAREHAKLHVTQPTTSRAPLLSRPVSPSLTHLPPRAPPHLQLLRLAAHCARDALVAGLLDQHHLDVDAALPGGAHKLVLNKLLSLAPLRRRGWGGRGRGREL